MTDWENIRGQFRAFDDAHYINTAATGLIPDSTLKIMTKHYEEHARRGAMALQTWAPGMENVRAKVAKLINADIEEIAIVPNMSIGMNWLAMMLKPLGSIAFPKEDFPSLTSPWKIQGYQTQGISNNKAGEINYEEIAASDAAIYANSHTQWHTGYRLDVDKLVDICHRNNQVLILDATQSLGAIEIDVKKTKVDIMVVSCYKWMMAGFGNCIIYVKKEILDKYPSQYAWQFRAALEGMDFFPNAKRFEVGHDRADAFFRLGNGVDLIQSIGAANIEKRVSRLSDYLYRKLEENDIKTVFQYPKENRSQIVIVEGSPEMANNLAEQNIFVSHRGTGIRIAPHFYNNEEDIDVFVQAMVAIKEGATI